MAKIALQIDPPCAVDMDLIRPGITRIGDLLFVALPDGVVITPRDHSYTRFISNSWYD